MPPLRQFRDSPASRGRPIQAPRPAIRPGAPVFLHELQQHLLRLFILQKTGTVKPGKQRRNDCNALS